MGRSDDGSVPRSREWRELLHERLVREAALPAGTPERTDLVVNLTRFFNRMGQDAEAVHRRLGWSWAGFRILNLLWVVGAVEARRLGELSGASRATISKLLGTLERDGLVRRDRSASDRRQLVVSLTEVGRTRLHAGLVAQADRDRAWLAVLDEREQRILGDLLGRLADQPTPQGAPLSGRRGNSS